MQYFSVDRARVPGTPPRSTADLLTSANQAHVAFEAVIAAMRPRMPGFDPAAIASALLGKDAAQRASALRIGADAIGKALGSAAAFEKFFGQGHTPRALMRFVSAGGVQDDIQAARTRGAALATQAAMERVSAPNNPNRTAGEVEYVDFLKSMRGAVEKAIEDGLLRPDEGSDFIAEVESSGTVDQPPFLRDAIQRLQKGAADEHFNEVRTRLMEHYRRTFSSLVAPEADPSKDRNEPGVQ